MTSASDLLPSLTEPASTAELPWELVRRTPVFTDLFLAEETSAWLASLPYSHRPVLLPQDFPRIANALATCWADFGLARIVLGEYLKDRRQNRQGFPPVVFAELDLLRELLDQ